MEIFRPTYVNIDLEALRNNFRKIKELANAHIMPAVKANAYGHGVSEAAKIFQEEEAEYLGVATIEEGIELRQQSITIPILILGSIYPMENFNIALKYNLTPTIASSYALTSLEERAKKRGQQSSFHLEIDTGMGRCGVSPEAAVKLWSKIEQSEYLICEGIFTHFSSADEDLRYTSAQIEKFNSLLENIKNPPKYIHAANTAGIINFPNTCFNMARPGIALYGLYPANVTRKDISLEPALSWISKIVFLKKVKKGTPISYGGAWRAPADSVIATICVGYADGYKRALFNKAEVIIRGKRCPVIGRICMDMIMADVSEINGVSVGDDVILLGEENGEKITAEEMADWARTINYEITTNISYRVPRVFNNEKAVN